VTTGRLAMRLDDMTDLDRFVDGFPHDVFVLVRREAPVWFHRPTAHTPGGEGFWVVSTHAECLAALGGLTSPARDGLLLPQLVCRHGCDHDP